MRGGSSKGLYFSASDLPSDKAAREKVLLAVMGSPDVRQIDGLERHLAMNYQAQHNINTQYHALVGEKG